MDLGLEALHPMDITTWSMVRTINQALDIIDEIDLPHFGLMLDLYNTWWDPQIIPGIRRAGAGGRIKGVHMADWRNPTRSFTDRTIPGRGIIPLERLIAEVEAHGLDRPLRRGDLLGRAVAVRLRPVAGRDGRVVREALTERRRSVSDHHP